MSFGLKNPNARQSPIVYLLRKSRGGHKVFLKYYPGITIKKDHWNKGKQRVREIKGVPYGSYNAKLKQIEDAVEIIFKQNDIFDLTSDIVRREIDKVLDRSGNQGDDGSFMSFLDTFIEYTKEKQGDRASKGMATMKNKLLPGTDWGSFDYQYYLRLILSLEKQGRALNYIGRIVKDLKIALNHAYKTGRINKKTWGDWIAPSEKVYNIYLSEEELERLYELAGLKPYQERARDLFLVGCYTGMRAENYLNIDPDLNIDLDKNHIRVIVNKNGPRVTIPIHQIVREIINKYNGLPKSISQQKLNKYIKEVAQKDEAGLKETVISAKTIGGKREVIVKEKWEMITTHTARRSLATNMHKNHVPLKFIMKITGHKTESQCLDYIKEVWDEDEEEIASLDFWNKKVSA